MPRPTKKRKVLEEGSGDETLPAVQKKTRPKRNTVKFADTDSARERIQTRPLPKPKVPKSILKAKSTPLLTSPASPKAEKSPTLKSSEQSEKKEVDREKGHTLPTLAATAIKIVEDARTEQLKPGLVAAHKESAFENDNIYKEVLLEAKELTETRNRAETALKDLKEALLANDRSENKVETLETQLKKSEEQVENLQRELAAIKEEKAEMEKILGEKTAKETLEAGKAVAK